MPLHHARTLSIKYDNSRYAFRPIHDFNSEIQIILPFDVWHEWWEMIESIKCRFQCEWSALSNFSTISHNFISFIRFKKISCILLSLCYRCTLYCHWRAYFVLNAMKEMKSEIHVYEYMPIHKWISRYSWVCSHHTWMMCEYESVWIIVIHTIHYRILKIDNTNFRYSWIRIHALRVLCIHIDLRCILDWDRPWQAQTAEGKLVKSHSLWFQNFPNRTLFRPNICRLIISTLGLFWTRKFRMLILLGFSTICPI